MSAEMAMALGMHMQMQQSSQQFGWSGGTPHAPPHASLVDLQPQGGAGPGTAPPHAHTGLLGPSKSASNLYGNPLGGGGGLTSFEFPEVEVEESESEDYETDPEYLDLESKYHDCLAKCVFHRCL